MTPHLIELVQAAARYTDVGGPVLEIGSYIEANQEHLDMRRAFPKGTSYLGLDVLEGPGVDRQIDLFDTARMHEVVDGFQPKTIFCLYVVEHVWDIKGAFAALGEIGRRQPESWVWVGTHQNQPFHGTDKYPDYWRVTAPAMVRLAAEAGLLGARVLVSPDTSNPSDVLVVRPPASVGWQDDAWQNVLKTAAGYAHWEIYG